MLTVRNSGDKAFALLAQKAVLNSTPCWEWPEVMRLAHTNEYRVVHLSFSFQDKAK